MPKEILLAPDLDQEKADPKDNHERLLIMDIRPELNHICANPVRASILYCLLRARDLGHSMRVEQLAKSTGKRHSVIIHHLEELSRFEVVKVVRSRSGGKTEKRRIWGLNTDCKGLVSLVYGHTLKNFFTVPELESLSSANVNVRTKKKSN